MSASGWLYGAVDNGSYPPPRTGNLRVIGTGAGADFERMRSGKATNPDAAYLAPLRTFEDDRVEGWIRRQARAKADVASAEARMEIEAAEAAKATVAAASADAVSTGDESAVASSGESDAAAMQEQEVDAEEAAELGLTAPDPSPSSAEERHDGKDVTTEFTESLPNAEDLLADANLRLRERAPMSTPQTSLRGLSVAALAVPAPDVWATIGVDTSGLVRVTACGQELVPLFASDADANESLPFDPFVPPESAAITEDTEPPSLVPPEAPYEPAVSAVAAHGLGFIAIGSSKHVSVYEVPTNEWAARGWSSEQPMAGANEVADGADAGSLVSAHTPSQDASEADLREPLRKVAKLSFQPGGAPLPSVLPHDIVARVRAACRRPTVLSEQSDPESADEKQRLAGVPAIHFHETASQPGFPGTVVSAAWLGHNQIFSFRVAKGQDPDAAAVPVVWTHTAAITAVASCGVLLAVGLESGKLSVWNVATRIQVFLGTIGSEESAVTALAFGGAATLVVGCSGGEAAHIVLPAGRQKVTLLPTPKLVKEPGGGGDPAVVGIAADRSIAVLALAGGQLVVLDMVLAKFFKLLALPAPWRPAATKTLIFCGEDMYCRAELYGNVTSGPTVFSFPIATYRKEAEAHRSKTAVVAAAKAHWGHLRAIGEILTTYQQSRKEEQDKVAALWTRLASDSYFAKHGTD